MATKTLENRQDPQFENILIDSIDAAFSSLGETAKKAIYYHMEHKFKIPKQDIPNNVDAFSDALELVFGLGAKNLEILIMRNLHEKVGSPRNNKMPSAHLTFREYVSMMKCSYAEKATSG